jgi:hypothetical protein
MTSWKKSELDTFEKSRSTENDLELKYSTHYYIQFFKKKIDLETLY